MIVTVVTETAALVVSVLLKLEISSIEHAFPSQALVVAEAVNVSSLGFRHVLSWQTAEDTVVSIAELAAV